MIERQAANSLQGKHMLWSSVDLCDGEILYFEDIYDRQEKNTAILLPHQRRLHVNVLNLAGAFRLHGGRSQSAGRRSRLGRRGSNSGGSSLGRRSSSRSADGTADLRRRSRSRRGRRATRADDRSRDVAALDVHSREVPVLSRAIVGQTENTKMPVGAVGTGGSRDRASDLL
jgi:hypothetical protein